jgi:hypothetical protein
MKMAANKKLLIVAGDGIGPEVMTEVKRVIGWFDKRQGLSFDVGEERWSRANYSMSAQSSVRRRSTWRHVARREARKTCWTTIAWCMAILRILPSGSAPMQPANGAASTCRAP